MESDEQKSPISFAAVRGRDNDVTAVRCLFPRLAGDNCYTRSCSSASLIL